MKNVNPLYIIQESRLDDLKAGRLNGAIAGGVLGAGIGNVVAHSLNNESKLVKNIILSSDTPKKCIRRIRDAEIKNAAYYINWVRRVARQKPHSWKQYLVRNINFGNLSRYAVGTLIGGGIGTKLGQIGGMYTVDRYL